MPPQSHQSNLNNGLALTLLLVMAVAPLPLGGNRPFFWAAMPLVIAIIGLCYGLLLALGKRPLRYRLGAIPEVPILGVVLLVYLAIQLLPLARFGLPIVHRIPEGVIESPTISLAPGGTHLMLLQFCGYGLLAFLIAQVAVNEKRARQFLLGLFLVVVLHAFLGLLSFSVLGDTILGAEKWAYFGSITGTFVNRNSFATFLGMGLVLGLAQVMGALGRVARKEQTRREVAIGLIVVALGTLLIFFALLGTQSRMGLFASACGALLVVGLGLLRGRVGMRVFVPVLLLILMLAIGGLFVSGAGIVERLVSVERDADVRGALYGQIWTMIRANPLLGYGGNSFEVAFPLFHQLPVSPDLVWDKAHSTYLALWSDLGVIAGSVPLLLVLLIVVRIGYAFLRSRIGTASALSALGVTMVAAVHSVVDFSLEIQAVAMMFVAVLAVATAGVAAARPRDLAPAEPFSVPRRRPRQVVLEVPDA